MTSSDHLVRCTSLRGGITVSEAAIIASLIEMEKRADMYAGICRGVAEALGLPTEGEGSSWSDLPEKVRIALLSHPAPAAPDALREAITVYVDRLRRGRDKHYINTLCVADDLDAALARQDWTSAIPGRRR